MTDEGNSQNEISHWPNEEIGVAVRSWLWVRVKLMAWWLSRLERLNGIQWSWVQISLRSKILQFSLLKILHWWIPYIYICIYYIHTYIYIYIYICMYVYNIYIYIYMVFTNEGFLEVRIEGFLTWVRFEPTTTEFHSGALTDWAIRPWV